MSKDNAESEWNGAMSQLFQKNGIFYLVLVPILDYLTKKYLEKVNCSPFFIYDLNICNLNARMIA